MQVNSPALTTNATVPGNASASDYLNLGYNQQTGQSGQVADVAFTSIFPSEAKVDDFRSAYKPLAEFSYSNWLRTLSSDLIADLAQQDRQDEEQTKLILNQYSRRNLKGSAGDSSVRNPTFCEIEEELGRTNTRIAQAMTEPKPHAGEPLGQPSWPMGISCHSVEDPDLASAYYFVRHVLLILLSVKKPRNQKGKP